MRESRAESIKLVVNLVYAIHRCVQVLTPEAAGDAVPALQQLIHRMRESMEQFEFELRTEVKRLGGELGMSRHDVGTDIQSAVEATLDAYRKALNVNVLAHTRAMLTRQSEILLKSYQEFVALSRAA